MKPFNQRVALVTGGSRGIGAGVCQALLAEGYRVAVGYKSQAAAAQSVASDPNRSMVVPISLADPDAVHQAFESVRARWGSIDVLVNNAAEGPEKPFLEITDAEWEHVLSVNLLGAVRCSREAIPDMLDKGFGRIINMSSIAGQWGGFYRVHYAASKAGLINLSQSLAKLYSKDGITCNAIAPGLSRPI